jgi:hypothetical protein
MDAISAAGTPCPDTSAYKNGQAVIIDSKEIVEVACRFVYRLVASGNRQPGNTRNIPRENRVLNLAGHLQFVFDALQATLSRQGASSGEWADRNEQHQDPNGSTP